MRMKPPDVRKKKEPPNVTKELSHLILELHNVRKKPLNVKKKKKPPNVTKELSHMMLELHNVRMKLSNVMIWSNRLPSSNLSSKYRNPKKKGNMLELPFFLYVFIFIFLILNVQLIWIGALQALLNFCVLLRVISLKFHSSCILCNPGPSSWPPKFPPPK